MKSTNFALALALSALLTGSVVYAEENGAAPAPSPEVQAAKEQLKKDNQEVKQDREALQKARAERKADRQKLRDARKKQHEERKAARKAKQQPKATN